MAHIFIGCRQQCSSFMFLIISLTKTKIAHHKNCYYTCVGVEMMASVQAQPGNDEACHLPHLSLSNITCKLYAAYDPYELNRAQRICFKNVIRL